MTEHLDAVSASRVLITQDLGDPAVAPLDALGVTLDHRRADAPLDRGDLVERARGATAVICLLTDGIGADLLATPGLRVVANVAAGVDNIDVEAATAAGVVVTNTPGVLTEATADLTLALILGAARRVPEGDAYLRAGRYTHWTLTQAQEGIDLQGATLGLYGFGLIAQAVARRAVGFGMTVQYHARSRRSPAEEAAAGDARLVGFDELVATSDVLSLHVPHTAETHHAIGAAQFEAMRPGALLINTARGKVVDEAALARALADSVIAGAGLDVYEHEPEVHPDLLEQRERVVLLPHLGSATAVTRRRMRELAVGSVVDALSERRPTHVVNPAAVPDAWT